MIDDTNAIMSTLWAAAGATNFCVRIAAGNYLVSSSFAVSTEGLRIIGARMAEIEDTIADFARAHRQTLDPQLPPIAGPRALLRAQLAEQVSRPPVRSWRW